MRACVHACVRALRVRVRVRVRVHVRAIIRAGGQDSSRISRPRPNLPSPFVYPALASRPCQHSRAVREHPSSASRVHPE